MRFFVDISRFSRFFTKDLSSLITRRSLVRILPPQPPCPPGKDIRADFLVFSRLRGLFCWQILIGNKKISSRDGMDLNYRSAVVKGGAIWHSIILRASLRRSRSRYAYLFLQNRLHPLAGEWGRARFTTGFIGERLSF